jgi:hypothetical protein
VEEADWSILTYLIDSLVSAPSSYRELIDIARQSTHHEMHPTLDALVKAFDGAYGRNGANGVLHKVGAPGAVVHEESKLGPGKSKAELVEILYGVRDRLRHFGDAGEMAGEVMDYTLAERAPKRKRAQ